MAGRVETEPEAPAGSESLVELASAEELPILLVDDRPENLRTLEAVLAPLGFPLVSATSGYKALRLLLERDFSLILLDVRMPGIDGLETARAIKSRPRTQDLPIVFLTAARDELGDIIAGYGVGAVDYVLKPFDAELLRSKVAVFVELERSRRALKRSEALLRVAFEAAPIGKTLLDSAGRIVLVNPAFARLLGREPDDLPGVKVQELCDPQDCEALAHELERVADPGQDQTQAGIDIRLLDGTGRLRWVGLVASSVEPTEFADPLLLAQWVDLSARRRAEQARAELLLEHAARTHAEAIAERLNKLQTLADATGSLSLSEVPSALALRLAEMFGADAVEVRVDRGPFGEPIVVRADHDRVSEASEPPQQPEIPGERWQEVPLSIDHDEVGMLRLALPPGRSFSAADRSVLADAADRAALAIQRAQLHEEEHRIAVELQRGLVPKRLPRVAGVALAALYQPAGRTAEVGGDWYDAFELPGGRVGVVVGDVAGKGIPAASTMGQLRSVTRAFALTDDGMRMPGDVLTRLNRYQVAHGEGELFTLVYAIVDPSSGVLTWACAGHLPPLLLTPGGQHAYLEGGEGLMGIEEVQYQDRVRSLAPGTGLILYTDGVVERRGESLDVGLERLAQAALSGPPEPDALCEHVLRLVLPPTPELHDDVTAMVVKL